MHYSQDIIDEICRRNDILDVISSHVKLTKKGSNYFGLCPFHSEKTGSFSVSPSKQMYHCFGCGAGGSVITFVMNMENYSFTEAIEYLAQRSNMTLPKPERSESQKEKESLRSQILDINREAGKYYYYQLRKEAGKRALAYLKNRGLTEDTMRDFGLGYARTGKGNVYDYLKSKGFEDGVLKQSGLFNADEKKGMMDKFWNRVIFPIMDIQNRIIGFGGRVMGEGTPKYLNSPETVVFDKGRNLYGLNMARKSRKNNLIICEGYMDVISMHQAGFSQTVASLGTALTMAQANLLKRYADEVFICYDSDEAGIKAALRAIPILRDTGLKCRVINMDPYKDPDEFIKNLGSEEFEKRMKEAENSFFYSIRMDERGFDLKDPDDKTRFYKNIAQALLKFDDAIERDNYLEAVCSKYRISRESLVEMVKKQAVLSENIRVYERPKPLPGREESEKGSVKAQKNLLTWLCEEKELFDTVRAYVAADDFSDGFCRELAQGLYDMLENNALNPALLISRYEEEDRQRQAAGILNAEMNAFESPEDKDRALKDLIIRIRSDSLTDKAAGGGGDAGGIQALIEKRKELERIKTEFARKTLIKS
ncbi:MAG: DNA primase [Lachnospiraceae bacterium]|nr:DNA primase [Lachnospiraceae bacterium]